MRVRVTCGDIEWTLPVESVPFAVRYLYSLLGQVITVTVLDDHVLDSPRVESDGTA